MRVTLQHFYLHNKEIITTTTIVSYDVMSTGGVYRLITIALRVCVLQSSMNETTCEI